MKVLNINNLLDMVSGGGTARRTLQMSRFLKEVGVNCLILTTDIGYKNCKTKVIEDIEVVFLPNIFSRFYFPSFSYYKIKKLVKDHDIIHMMGHWNIINIYVYFVARQLKKPYVICPAGSLPIYGRSKLLKRLYNLIIGKRIIRNASGYIAITDDEIFHFQEYGIEKDKITIIPNGILKDDFLENNISEFRKKYSLGNVPFILFMGRLNWIKGPDLLLQAFSNVKDVLPEYHLVFAGPDIGMLSILMEMSQKLDISERVHFLGYIDGAAKSRAYYSCELLVIPSRHEAMSIVVLEAGITGTPVLITDQCGFEELADIKGGVVVQANVEGLERGLVEMLQDKDKLNFYGDNLKKYVEQKYTWDSIINQYLELYNQILN